MGPLKKLRKNVFLVTAIGAAGIPLISLSEELEDFVVVKYASEGKICLSGMVQNEKDLQGKAAIIDMPLGKGHIMMFTFNPF